MLLSCLPGMYSAETCRNVIICKLIVLLLVIVQKNTRMCSMSGGRRPTRGGPPDWGWMVSTVFPLSNLPCYGLSVSGPEVRIPSSAAALWVWQWNRLSSLKIYWQAELLVAYQEGFFPREWVVNFRNRSLTRQFTPLNKIFSTTAVKKHPTSYHQQLRSQLLTWSD